MPEQGVVEYNITDAAIAKMEADYMCLAITDIADEEQINTVHAARMVVKGKRVEVEKTRKGLKAGALEWGRKVDTEAKRIFGKLEPIETHLNREEKKVTDEQKRIKAEEERKEKEKIQGWIDTLAKHNVILPYADVAVMTDEEADTAMFDAKEAFRFEQERLKKEEAERKAEAERLEKVRLEQEAEAEKLRLEKEAMEEEKRKLEVEKKAIEDAKQAEKDRLERLALEEQERIEQSAYEEQERKDKEKRDKEEAIKKENSRVFVYAMPIPVTVLSFKDEDGITIGSVSVPDEEELYKMVDKHAKEIKKQAEAEHK